MSEIAPPPDGWTEVSPKIVAVGTRLAFFAPKMKWTPALVGNFIRSLEKAGYAIVDRPSPTTQENENE